MRHEVEAHALAVGGCHKMTRNYQKIFDCLKKKAGADLQTIARLLGLSEDEEEELNETLDKLEQAGYVLKNKWGKYAVSSKGFLHFDWGNLNLERECILEKLRRENGACTLRQLEKIGLKNLHSILQELTLDNKIEKIRWVDDKQDGYRLVGSDKISREPELVPIMRKHREKLEEPENGKPPEKTEKEEHKLYSRYYYRLKRAGIEPPKGKSTRGFIKWVEENYEDLTKPPMPRGKQRGKPRKPKEPAEEPEEPEEPEKKTTYAEFMERLDEIREEEGERIYEELKVKFGKEPEVIEEPEEKLTTEEKKIAKILRAMLKSYHLKEILEEELGTEVEIRLTISFPPKKNET